MRKKLQDVCKELLVLKGDLLNFFYIFFKNQFREERLTMIPGTTKD